MKRWPWILFLLGLLLIYVVGPSIYSAAHDGVTAGQAAVKETGDASQKAAHLADGILDILDFTLYGLIVQGVGFLFSGIGLLVGLVDVIRHSRKNRGSAARE